MRAAYAWVERRWPRTPHTLLIEKSANGTEIIAALKRELTGVLSVSVSTDKITRAMAAQPPLEAGNIYLPGRAAPDTAAGYEAAQWVSCLIEEAATFPNGTHDDQVDAYSQAINWARGRNNGTMRISIPQGRIPTHDDHLSYLHARRPSPLLDRRSVSFAELGAIIGVPVTHGYGPG